MFITEDVLNTEKDHVEGFAPEVGLALLLCAGVEVDGPRVVYVT
jgi:hypothetical protein